jgi:general secretion pathway protein N
LAVVEPTGDLLVHIATLSLVDGAILGNGVVEWRAAGSSLTSVAPLGDYELSFQGSAGGLHASLRTVKGLLQLEGTGSRGKTGPPLFFATARVGAEHQLQLAPLLRLIGIERGKGNFTLQLNQDIGRAPDI